MAQMPQLILIKKRKKEKQMKLLQIKSLKTIFRQISNNKHVDYTVYSYRRIINVNQNLTCIPCREKNKLGKVLQIFLVLVS